MATVRIITQTILTNTLDVDEDMIKGMTAEALSEFITDNGELFRDDQPLIDGDQLVQVYDTNDEQVYEIGHPMDTVIIP